MINTYHGSNHLKTKNKDAKYRKMNEILLNH
jgi:hypothetical protein